MSEQGLDYIKGRNLTLLSTAIIIYVLAGGEFKGEGYILGGLIEFSHPKWIEASILFIFGFSIFQFWIFQDDIKQTYAKDILDKIANNGNFREFLSEKSRENLNYRYNNRITLLDEREPQSGVNKIENVRVQIVRNKNVFGTLKLGKGGQFYSDLNIIEENEKGNSGKKVGVNYNVPLTRLLPLGVLLKSTVSVLCKEKSFWGNTFPFFIAFLAIVAVGYEFLLAPDSLDECTNFFGE